MIYCIKDGQTITGDYYNKLLPILGGIIKERRRGMLGNMLGDLVFVLLSVGHQFLCKKNLRNFILCMNFLWYSV